MARPTSRKSTRRTRAADKQTGRVPKAHTKVTNIAATNGEKATSLAKKRWWQPTPKTERPTYPKLPNVIRLTRKTYDLLMLNWRLILGIAVLYGVLNILFVRGFNGGLDVSDLKSQFSQLFHGGWGNVASGFAIFGLLVSSSNTTAASDTASAYQSFLVLITSLALIWTYRQLLADRPLKLRIRDGFYKGMYPLVPALLVLFVIAIQLIPMVVGALLYGTVISDGIAITTPEVIGWFVFLVLCILWSLLLITASIFALCIVTLPDMSPRSALRSARKLVKFRRLVVLRKLLFLPLLLVIILAAIMLPTIWFAAVLAQWVFFVLSMFILPVSVAYIYTLYRELLNE